jgi:transcriptional regulator with XRE-family HTH domain
MTIGGVVDRSGDASTLGDLLRGMKEQSGLSYEELARKVFLSRSTLHRYCTGRSIPRDVAIATRIAQACGADKNELRETLQAWLVADNRQQGPPVLLTATTVEPPDECTVSRPDAIREAFHGSGDRVRGRRSRIPIAIILVLLVAFTAFASSVPDSPSSAREVARAPQWITGPSWVVAPSPVKSTMFGVTAVSDTGEMPSFRIGAVRFWDSDTRWAQLQPRRDVFDWTTLDRLVASAHRARLPALFVIGGTPEWATAPNAPKAPYGDGSRAAPPMDLRDWDLFVRALVSRFRGRIEAYELWVLANDSHYFTGSTATLVEMTRRANHIIKSIDPKAITACPGMGQLWEPDGRRILKRFAELGGYRYCDVASIKLYQRTANDPPETMLEILQAVDSTMHKAGVNPVLWSTGTNYDIATQPRLDDEQAISHAVRFYLTGLYGRELNLQRMYFYSWGNTKIPIVLQAEEGAPTKAALAIEELQGWLANAQVRSCGRGTQDQLPPNVWQCDFIVTDFSGTHPAMIRWTYSGTANTTAPRGARLIRRLNGLTTSIDQNSVIPVDQYPILIEYQ